MKIERRFIDSIDFEFANGIMIGIWQCLSEILLYKRYNWNTWQFINIEFENDIVLGAYEFTFVLLCCGIRIRIPHQTKKSKKEWKKLNKSMKDIDKSCYGWVGKDWYNCFKNAKKDCVVMEVRNKKNKTHNKKIFIQ